jgi:hypothetical protein
MIPTSVGPLPELPEIPLLGYQKSLKANEYMRKQLLK